MAAAVLSGATVVLAVTAGLAHAGAPAGATARCRDGTYSYSRTHSGTCSHHGGVARWLDGSSSTGSLASSSTQTATRARIPGAYNPAVTQATIHTTICVPGWTRTVRPPSSYTSALKRTQLARYRDAGPPSAYEEDHFIPLELGGAPRDPRNLWPEPRPRANDVDSIENALRRQVCAGTITLAVARTRIAAIKHSQG